MPAIKTTISELSINNDNNKPSPNEIHISPISLLHISHTPLRIHTIYYSPTLVKVTLKLIFKIK